MEKLRRLFNRRPLSRTEHLKAALNLYAAQVTNETAAQMAEDTEQTLVEVTQDEATFPDNPFIAKIYEQARASIIHWDTQNRTELRDSVSQKLKK